MFIEIVVIDEPWRCECWALVLAMCSICGLNHRSRGTQGPDRKQVMGGVAARHVKDGDLHLLTRDILVEALVIEEDMPAHMVVGESLDKRIRGGCVDTGEDSRREHRRRKRGLMEEHI